MVANPDINNLIYMFRYYQNEAVKCFEVYPDMVDAYFMYDCYMEVASGYEAVLKGLL